jgi:S-formylglutathione hydrolase
MKFTVYVPDGLEVPAPVLYYLSGMFCSEQSFIQKSGFQRWANFFGIIVVSPDVAPRVVFGAEKNEIETRGLSLYVDATKKPWSKHYNMFSYVNEELPSIIQEHFNVDKDKQSIMGHSMGGHGALLSAIKNPGKYLSVSVLSPVCNPSQAPDLKKVLVHYFGDDMKVIEEWDATCLAASYKGPKLNILIHKGTNDEYEEHLKVDNFVKACEKSDIEVSINFEKGYDHGFYFISSFIDQHFQYHAKFLCKS